MMADFQFHESDDLQDAAFSWLKKRCYLRALGSFQKLISQTKLKLNDVQGDQFNETLRILGKLRRGLAEAWWYVGRFQPALSQIQLCISENCHEFSEVSENSNVARLCSRSLGEVHRLHPRKIASNLSFARCF